MSEENLLCPCCEAILDEDEIMEAFDGVRYKGEDVGIVCDECGADLYAEVKLFKVKFKIGKS